jgi:hypothetical protein
MAILEELVMLPASALLAPPARAGERTPSVSAQGRQHRLQAWFKRHGWLAAILAALGLAGVFSIRLSGSDEASNKDGDT